MFHLLLPKNRGGITAGTVANPPGQPGNRRFRDRTALALGLSLLLLATCLMSSACITEYDFETERPERASFGAEVYKVVHKDAVRSKRSWTERGDMLVREREAIILGLDTMVPEGLPRLLDSLLRRLTHLTDNGTLPRITRRMAQIFGLVRDNPELRADWEADNQGRFEGYRHPTTHGALLQHITAYPRLGDASLMLGNLYLNNDGFDDSGNSDPNEPFFMTDAVRLLADELRTFEPDPDPERLTVQVADVMLTSDPAFDVPGSSSLPAVKVDHRGMPLVTRRADGSPSSPFVDVDGDGYADINDQRQFVGANGAPLDVPAFGQPGEITNLVERDALGRVTSADGFAFEYTDLSESALAFLVRQQGDMIQENPDVLFDLGVSLDAVLPERVNMPIEETGSSYFGYPLQGNPLVDLIYGALELLAFPALDELLDVQSRLMRDHADELAEVLYALELFGDLEDDNGDPDLEEDNSLVDDVIPLIADLATEKGLIAQILDGFNDPVSAVLAPANLDMLDWKADRAYPAPGGPYETCFATCERNHTLGTINRAECIRACPNQEIFRTPVDRTRGPDFDNRSHFQRLLHLFADADGVAYDMKVTLIEIDTEILGIPIDVDIEEELLPPLLRFDNASASMLDAIAGNLYIGDYVTEEALAHHDVEVLVDLLDTICGSSILQRFAEAVVPLLIAVTEQDLINTCDRFEEVSADDSRGEEYQRRAQIGLLVTFLSLLSDVSFSEYPTPSQMTRFFNLEDPAVDLGVARLSLNQLITRDGYENWASNGDMLYAAEASGTIDALYPVIKPVSDAGKAETLVRLVTTLHEHYAPPDVTYPKADGTPIFSHGTGVWRFEKTLRDWFEQDRITPALQGLARANRNVESRRGTPANDVLEDLVAYLVVPDATLTHMDGRTSSLTNDGRVVEPLSRFYLLADPVNDVNDRIKANPAVEERWDRATEGLFNVLLGTELADNGDARFSSVGAPVLTAVIADHLSERASKHRDDGRLREVVTGEYFEDITDLFTGRLLPILVDLLLDVDQREEDKALLADLLLYNVQSDAGVNAMVVKLYEFFSELFDAESFQISAAFYGDVIDPNRAWEPQPVGDDVVGTNGPPLLTDVMRAVRDTAEVDGDDVVPTILRGAFTRQTQITALDGDPAGGYPMSELGRTIKYYNRPDPLSEAPLSSEDYELICRDVSTWLLNDQTGAEQVFDLIEAREK